MAKNANTFRKATVDLLIIQILALQKSIGVAIKSYRDYEASKKPSKTQKQVANAAGTHESVVSKLETGKAIPVDLILQRIMTEVGLNLNSPEANSLYELLRSLRDRQKNLVKLKKHAPK